MHEVKPFSSGWRNQQRLAHPYGTRSFQHTCQSMKEKKAIGAHNIVSALATRITVICTEKTDKITYVLLVKIVTDEPINSPNFYRWLWEQSFFSVKIFFFKKFIRII